MSEPILPGPVPENACIREAACIHTRKIYDSCQSKDCIENLVLYPTTNSLTVLDDAQSIKSGRAELLYVQVTVDPMGFNQGFYTIDLRFFYRITADAYASGSCRPTVITGLAVYEKRCMLFGSQGSAKIFTSTLPCPTEEQAMQMENNLPTAVVEAVDPVILDLKLAERCSCGCTCPTTAPNVPEGIQQLFDDTLVMTDTAQKLVLLTLGQFSLLRMERDSQLLIPIYDYCMPQKECLCEGPEQADPCQLFQRVDFPVSEFFPPADLDTADPMVRLKCSCGCSR